MTEDAATTRPDGGPQQVGVVGAGTMGVGIAVVMARAGHHVVVRDVDSVAVQRGVDQVKKFFDRSVQIGKLSEEGRDDAVSRVKGTVDLGALASSDVVVEAIFEDTDLKARLFNELDDVC